MIMYDELFFYCKKFRKNILFSRNFPLLVFKPLYITTFSLGWTANSPISFLESILSGHLYALIFLLGRSVNHKTLDQRCSNAVRWQRQHLNFFMQLVDI